MVDRVGVGKVSWTDARMRTLPSKRFGSGPVVSGLKRETALPLGPSSSQTDDAYDASDAASSQSGFVSLLSILPLSSLRKSAPNQNAAARRRGTLLLSSTRRSDF